MQINVSFIIPVYNSENSILDCLNSIICQLYDINYEVILIDDSSTDSSCNKIHNFIEEHPEIHISFYKNEINKGPGYSRNIGIRKSVGDFICFCDADDKYAPCFLKYMYAMINYACKDLVYCGYDIINSANEIIVYYHEKWPYPDNYDKIVTFYFQSKIHFSHAGAIYRRAFLIQNNLFYNDLCHCGEDIEFMCNILLSNPRCGYVNKSLYYYNTSSSIITKTMNAKKIMDSLNALDRVLRKIKSLDLKLKFILGRYASLSYHSLEISYMQKIRLDIPFFIKWRLILLSIIYLIRKKCLFSKKIHKILFYSIHQ